MKWNPFERLPIILYVLIVNVLFAQFLDVSLSAYIFQKWFPELTPDDNETLLAVGYIIAMPYLVGELLYRAVYYVKHRASKQLREKINAWGSFVFEWCSFILCVLLTFHNFTFGMMLGSRGLKGERGLSRREVYEALHAISYEEAKTLGEEELCERLSAGNRQIRIIRGGDCVILQSAGRDQTFDTVDDVICIKHAG